MPNEPRDIESRLLVERDIARARVAMIEQDLERLRPKPFGPGDAMPEPPTLHSNSPARLSTRIRALGTQVGRDIRALRSTFRHLGEQTNERFNRTEAVTGRLSGEVHWIKGMIRSLADGLKAAAEFEGMIAELNRDLTDLGRNTAGAPAVERLERQLSDLGRQLGDVQTRVGTHLLRNSNLDLLERKVLSFDKWLGAKGIDVSRIEELEKRIEGFESKLAALNPVALGEMIADLIIAHTEGRRPSDASIRKFVETAPLPVPPISSSEPTSIEEDEELTRRRASDGPREDGSDR